MCRARFLMLVVCVLGLIFVAACGGSLPSQDEYVKIPEIREQEISIDTLESVKSKYNIDIPFSVSAPGSSYYAVVIPFDIQFISTDVTYDEVRVTMDIVETDGTTTYKDTGDIRILAPIPGSVDRNSEVEEMKKVTVGFVAAVNEITGKADLEQQITEKYAKLYRTVTANQPTITTVSWTFTPFKDEPVLPGTNYLVALIEVRDRAHKFTAKVHTNCTYGMPILFGFRDKKDCISDVRELPLLQSEKFTSDIMGIDIASNDHVYAWYSDRTVSSGTDSDFDKDRALYPYALPGGKSPADIVGMGIACSDDHVYTWYTDGQVSAGTNSDLDEYRPLYSYTLPNGKSPSDILGISIASDDHVYVWYTDGTVSSGTTSVLDEYRAPYPYTIASGKSPGDIVDLGIACSNDYVYTWYMDGTVSIGTSWDLADVQEPYLYFLP